MGAALLRRRLFRLFIGVFARRRSLFGAFARGQRPGQRPPASFGRPARPESRCPDRFGRPLRPPGHSRGVLVRCLGKGDASAMAVAATTRFSGRAFWVPLGATSDRGRMDRHCRPASPDQAPYAVAEAVFADAKAYLSSREAQQMSESELERELHRRGQELMRRLLQGHLDQRTPGEAAGPVEGVDDVERSQRRLQERHPETTFGTVQVARPGGWRSSMAPRRSSTARAPPSTLRCGNRFIHVAEYVCKAVEPSPPASSKGRARTCSATVMEFTGALVNPDRCFIHARVRIRRVARLGWSRGGSKIRVLRSQPRPRCVMGQSPTREYRGTTPSDTLMEIARPVSNRPPHHAFDGVPKSLPTAGRHLGPSTKKSRPIPDADEHEGRESTCEYSHEAAHEHRRKSDARRPDQRRDEHHRRAQNAGTARGAESDPERGHRESPPRTRGLTRHRDRDVGMEEGRPKAH